MLIASDKDLSPVETLISPVPRSLKKVAPKIVSVFVKELIFAFHGLGSIKLYSPSLLTILLSSMLTGIVGIGEA